MLVVEKDEPGRVLTLAWRGAPPRLGRRIFLFALWVAAIGVGAIAILLPGGDSVFGHLFVGLLLLFPGYVTLSDLRHRLPYWSRIAWYGRETRFFARLSGYWFLGAREFAIPFSALREVRFEIGADAPPPGARARECPSPARPTPLLLRLAWQDGPGPGEPRRLAIAFQVQGLDRRAEALDFFSRVAAILRRPFFVVRRSDHRCLKLDLFTDRESAGAGASPVPTPGAPADYDRDGAIAPPAPPPVAVDAYRHYPGKPLGRYTIDEWQPGRRVRISRAANLGRDLLDAASAGCGVAFLAGFAALIAGELAGGAGARSHAALVALGAGAVAMAWRVVSDHGRSTLLDWTAGRAVFRRAALAREAPLATVRAVVLRGREAIRRISSVPYTFYWCELGLELEGGAEELLLATNEFVDDPDAPYHQLAPIAMDLAGALGVPFRWHEFEDASVRSVVREAISS